jgi:predicted amidophosphoribosyltransferase
MWQIHFCPQCGARAKYSDRFCGTCGFNLTSVLPQVPPLMYDYQYPFQQWVPYSPAYNQEAASVNAGQYQQRNATPMSAEIAKLLGDLFDKRLRYNKT